MNRTYSVFVTDDELLASPYIRRFNYLHDLTLNLGQAEDINFLLQHPLSKHQRKQLQVQYDQTAITVQSTIVVPYNKQTLVTLRVIPKELGTIRIGLSYPESRLKRAHPLLHRRNLLWPRNRTRALLGGS